MPDLPEVRLARELGLDPYEIAKGSFTIAPLGAAYVVKWQAVRIFTAGEVVAAMLASARERQIGSEQ